MIVKKIVTKMVTKMTKHKMIKKLYKVNFILIKENADDSNKEK